MRLSLQAQYAICGLFDLAYNGQGAPIQVRVLGERQGIPHRYLEQIFQRLRRAKLVQSKRGPGGGYTLARPADEITLCQVVEAIEGPLERRVAPSGGGRGRSGAYRPSFVWEQLAAGFRDVLANVTLDSLCREAARAAVRRADDESQMYFI